MTISTEMTTFGNQIGWKEGVFAYDDDGDRTGTPGILYWYAYNRMKIAGRINYEYSLAGVMTKAGMYAYGAIHPSIG